MLREHKQMYYGEIATLIAGNAVLGVRQGNTEEAKELARNAATFAFLAYPELRESSV